MIKTVLTMDDDTVEVSTANVSNIDTKFSPGFYSSYFTDSGILIKKEVLEELNKPFPCKEFIAIDNYCKSFYQKELKDKVNKMGFKHKLGILLHGKQGTGKTTFMYYLANEVVTGLGGIALIARDASEIEAVMYLTGAIRQIQDNPVVIIADEFERWAEKAESKMKTFLDGIDSVDNTLFLASTNYLDKVPNSLKQRPSRFRAVYEIKDITDPVIIKDLIKSKSDLIDLFSEEELDSLSKELSKTGVTLDELKTRILDSIISCDLEIKTPTIGFTKKEEIKERPSSLVFNYGLTSLTINKDPLDLCK